MDQLGVVGLEGYSVRFLLGEKAAASSGPLALGANLRTLRSPRGNRIDYTPDYPLVSWVFRKPQFHQKVWCVRHNGQPMYVKFYIYLLKGSQVSLLTPLWLPLASLIFMSFWFKKKGQKWGMRVELHEIWVRLWDLRQSIQSWKFGWVRQIWRLGLNSQPWSLIRKRRWCGKKSGFSSAHWILSSTMIFEGVIRIKFWPLGFGTIPTAICRPLPIPEGASWESLRPCCFWVPKHPKTSPITQLWGKFYLSISVKFGLRLFKRKIYLKTSIRPPFSLWTFLASQPCKMTIYESRLKGFFPWKKVTSKHFYPKFDFRSQKWFEGRKVAAKGANY